MLVAITGTPGTGKTTLFHLLLESMGKRGYQVMGLDLNNFLREHCLLTSRDEKRGSFDVHLTKMREIFRKEFLEEEKEAGIILVEGHLSHYLNPELCLLLRCAPFELKRRLKKRGYIKEKIRENMEAEALNIIRDEYLEICCGGYHSYYTNFLSIYKWSEGNRDDRYLPHPYYSHGLDTLSWERTPPLIEIDTTYSSSNELCILIRFLFEHLKENKIKNLKRDKKSFPDNKKEIVSIFKVGIIDWSSEILTWY